MSNSSSLSRFCTEAELTWTIVGVFALVMLLYIPSLQSSFVSLDDGQLITSNPDIHGITPHTLGAVFSKFDPELYIPLTFITYQVDYLIAGLHPWIYHATNAIFHACNALLVMWLILLLTQKRHLALLAGLLFAVHPLNVEAVAWASARKDLVSTFFALWSMILYVRYREEDNVKLYYWCLGTFVCALLSKASVLFLPLVLFLFDYLEGRTWKREMILEKVPFLLASIIFGLIAMVGKQDGAGLIDPVALVLLAGKSSIFYVQKLIWPTGLSILYPYTNTVRLLSPDIAVPCVTLVILCLLVVWNMRKTRVVFFAVGFYLLFLSPSFTNVVKGGIPYFASDRYAYVGSIGILLLVVLCWERVSQMLSHQKQFILTSITCAVLFVFSIMTVMQDLTWKNSVSLFQNVTRFYPNSFAAHVNLAVTNRASGKFDAAEEEVQKALSIHENARAYAVQASIDTGLGRTDDAIRMWTKALVTDPSDADSSFGLASALATANRMAEAEQYYKQTIFLSPHYSAARNNLAAIYQQEGRLDDAAEQYRQITSYDSGFFIGYFNLGMILEQQGKTREAVSAYEHAMSIQKPKLDLLSHVGPLYVTLDRPDDAIAIFAKGVAMDPTDQDFLQETLDGLRTVMQKHPQNKPGLQLLQDLLDQGILEKK